MSEILKLQLSEWERIEPIPQGPLHGVFLNVSPATRRTVDQLAASRMLVVEELRHGLRIHATSFVGRITLGDLQITVQPKITGMPLLTLLRYAFGLRNLQLLEQSDFNVESSVFQDLLIAQLIAEVEELMARGLVRQYARIHEELASPRGRIDLQSVAKTGIASLTKLPCSHFPRLHDWLPNQLVLAGLKLAASIAIDTSLRVDARRLSALLGEDVSPLSLDSSAYSNWRRIQNRQTRAYEPAITLIELLVAGSGISLEHGEAAVSLSGFFFDMNRFFQALLSRFLRENLAGYTVKDEQQLRGMMAYVPGKNPNRRRNPSPRPDFAVLREGMVVCLLDAKYRDLWNKALPRDMLYQLAIYGLSQVYGREAIILYPTVESAIDATIEVRDPILGRQPAFVTQRPVHLLQLAGLLQKRGHRGSSDAKSLARQWIGIEQ